MCASNVGKMGHEGPATQENRAAKIPDQSWAAANQGAGCMPEEFVVPTDPLS